MTTGDHTQPPQDKIPGRWAGLDESEQRTLMFFSHFSDEEKQALKASLKDRIFWHSARKRIAGVGGVIVAITGLFLGITGVMRFFEGWFK